MRGHARLAAAIVALLFACSSGAPRALAAPDAAEARGVAAITSAELMRTDRWLAAPDRGGRLAGSPGYWDAARAMAKDFAAAGLEPAGDDGYFQRVDVEYDDVRACALSWSGADGRWRAFAHGPDFTVRGLSGSGRFEAPVVFAGYGVSWPERGWDDYAGLDVRGKVVLVIKEPSAFLTDSLHTGDRTLTRPRARAAAAHGAIGLLMVSSPNQPRPQKPIASMLEGPGPEDPRFPSMQLSVAAAESLLAGTGERLGALQAAIDSARAPRSRPLASRVRMRVDARYEAARRSCNVVGTLRGADPALAREVVVVGAHLDHVGTQAGLVFRGANDNASGASSIRQLVRAFAATGVRPRRTVVFALFTSEESGLQGSRHFVEHLPVPASDVVAFLNMDCVGVGDSLEVHGGQDWPKLWSVVTAADADGSARCLMAHTGRGGGADAQPFADRGIPTAYFASHFSYSHLHLPSDTPETLNPALLEAIARTAFRTAWRLAQGEASR